MPSFGDSVGGINDSSDVGFGGGSGSFGGGAGISDRDAGVGFGDGPGGADRSSGDRDFSQAVNYGDLTAPSPDFTGLIGSSTPTVSAMRSPTSVASYDALAGPEQSGGLMSTGFDPYAAVGGVAATMFGGPLLGALAYRGIDAARGWFNDRPPEDDDVTLGDLFDFDMGVGDAAQYAGQPQGAFGRDMGWSPYDEYGSDQMTRTSDVALQAAGEPPVSDPLPATEAPAELANKYAARPDLVYGPYFNYATGAFDAPGGRPYADLVRRYGVNAGG